MHARRLYQGYLQVNARMWPSSPTLWPQIFHSGATLTLWLVPITRLPSAPSIVIVNSSRLSLRSRSRSDAAPFWTFSGSGFNAASATCPLDSLWNVFHDENGGFLSFFSSGLSSASIAGALPLLAVISRKSHSALPSACATPANAMTRAKTRQRLICPRQY